MENSNVIIFNQFCKNKECPEYIEWTFDMGSSCTSCKLLGQSYDITEYPTDCLFLDEIREFEFQQNSIEPSSPKNNTPKGE